MQTRQCGFPAAPGWHPPRWQHRRSGCEVWLNPLRLKQRLEVDGLFLVLHFPLAWSKICTFTYREYVFEHVYAQKGKRFYQGMTNQHLPFCTCAALSLPVLKRHPTGDHILCGRAQRRCPPEPLITPAGGSPAAACPAELSAAGTPSGPSAGGAGQPQPCKVANSLWPPG